jgi:hypothetical protein
VASEARTPVAACSPLKMKAAVADLVLGPVMTKLTKSNRSFCKEKQQMQFRSKFEVMQLLET